MINQNESGPYLIQLDIWAGDDRIVSRGVSAAEAAVMVPQVGDMIDLYDRFLVTGRAFSHVRHNELTIIVYVERVGMSYHPS